MTIVAMHRTNPHSGEQRSVAVEGGKVKNYSGTYSFGVENENLFYFKITGKCNLGLTTASVNLGLRFK